MAALDKALKCAKDLNGLPNGISAEVVTGSDGNSPYLGIVLGDVTIWTSGVRMGPEEPEIDLSEVKLAHPESVP
jgi:hypothetical protein